MFGPFNSRVANEIGIAMGKTSEEIRRKRERSTAREVFGNKPRKEESDTDELVDDMETSIRKQINETKKRVSANGANIDIEFHTTIYNVGEENRWGPDLGIRLHIENPDFNVTKGILLQNKRVYGTAAAPTIDALRGDGEAQAEKMLKITPASFFLLFNGLPVEEVHDILDNFGFGWPWPRPFREEFRFIKEVYGESHYILNTGILVLPATRVFAESKALADGRKLNTDALHWIQSSIPFGVFLISLFGGCIVGDARESVLDLVTPPKLRGISGANMLPVRRLMEIIVRPENPPTA